MAEAILRIRTEGAADVKRALGATQNAVKSAAQAMSASARAAARDQDSIAKAASKSAKDAERAAKEAIKAKEKAEKDAAAKKEQAERKAAAAAKQRAAEERREANRTAAEKKRIVSDEARTAAKAENEKTRTARKESSERKREAEKEARNKALLAKQSAKDAERAERDHSRAVERESNRRQARHAAERQRMRDRAFGAASFVARTAVSSGVDLVGEARAARRQVAGGERAITNAIFQAGGDRSEAITRRGQLLELAQRNGMTFDQVANAAIAAQTEFSPFGERGSERSDRDQRFASFARSIEFAAATGNDAGEVARLQGMLSQSRFSQETQRSLMNFAAGAAQSGAIELGSLTREGLGSIMLAMNTEAGKLGAGATPAQREAAMASAFRQQVAAMEVFRGQGQTARLSGNALQSMRTALLSSSRQDKILNNIATAERGTSDPARRDALANLRAQMFEDDPTRQGQRRLRDAYTDPMQFHAAIARAVGYDPAAAANLLGGGGQGNPQSLLANQRTLLSLLTARDAGGRMAADRVIDLQNASLSSADLARGRDMFLNDTQANLNREETQRLKTLTDNNSRLAQLAASLDRFRAENPVGAALARSAGGEAGEIAASMGHHSAAEPGWLTRLVLEPAVRRRGGLSSPQYNEAIAAADARANQGTGLLQRLRESFTLDGDRERKTRVATEMTREIGSRGGNVPEYLRSLPDAVRQGVEAALRSQQAGAFARANAATGANSTPPELRSRG